MSFPTKCWILAEVGNQIEIAGALAWTRKRVLYSESAYRDSFNAAFMGGAIPNTSNVTGGKLSGALLAENAAASTTYLTQVPASIAAPAANVQVLSLSDEIGHYPWRIKVYVRYLIQFWDATTVGQAMTISATTVSGNPTITVPDSELLTPGQAITGTGIPTGTIVLRTIAITEGLPVTTAAILSQNATASATVAATLTGANCLASYFEDEIIGWGGPISFPT